MFSLHVFLATFTLHAVFMYPFVNIVGVSATIRVASVWSPRNIKFCHSEKTLRCYKTYICEPVQVSRVLGLTYFSSCLN